jgi:tRNA A-37 threonylcarbamoyl transferase component Bud32
MTSKARIGTEFAGYRLEALLGRGGTSTVYRAESPRLGIRVALKILNAEVSDDEAFRERFVREARLVARIEHPNVISIYDADAWGDELYIAMRYVPGGDLKGALAGGPLDPERALAILAQAASGLDEAHARGLVHRDVKPANLMLDRGGQEGGPETVYVTDFGLTKHAHSGGAATPTGVLLGTIDYVAPEQIEGRTPDGRADAYSLGCVAFECLTGRRPFERENEAAVLWAHMQESPPSVRDLAPELPRGLDEPIARALAKDPNERFSTCAELVEALRGPIEAGRSGRSAAAPPPAPSRVRLLAAAAAGVALGAAGVGAAVALGDRGPALGAAGTVETRTVVSTVVSTVTEGATEVPVYIPQQFRDRCRVARPQTADFAASYVCTMDGAVESVRFSHAVSGPLLSSFLRRRMERVGLRAPASDQPIVAEGSCAEQDLPAIEHWFRLGRAGHQSAGELAVGAADGRVLCYEEGGRAHIEWTTGVLGVYAHAYGPRFSSLYAWWRTNAGPVS